MKLWKAHGLGNDYLVWEGAEDILTPSIVRDICDRHCGLGGDGVLEPMRSDQADIAVRIWNPDGSIAEKSGNGLRIFAWWAHRRAGLPMSLSIDTGFSVVHCVINSLNNIVVEMGCASFDAAAIPTTVALWGSPYELSDVQLRLWAVSIGNPHCVCLFPPETILDDLPWQIWGRALEFDAKFPNRTNVQFASVRSPREIELRIWERGAGETSASGSSACAVAAVARRLGLVEPSVTLIMPGGDLRVDVRDSFDLLLSGPIQPIGDFTFNTEWSEKRC